MPADYILLYRGRIISLLALVFYMWGWMILRVIELKKNTKK